MRKLAIALGIVLLVLLVLDRVGAFAASGVVADRIRSAGGLADEPDVTIHGFPFLDQALRGEYEDVEITASGIETGGLRDIRVNAHFRGLHASTGDIIGGDLDRITVDRVDGTATLRYDDLERAIGVPDLSLEREGDGIRIRAPLVVAGQELNVSARAQVGLAGRNGVVVQAQDPTVDGQPLPPAAAAEVVRRLTYLQTLDGLPYNLTVTGIRTTDEGLAVEASARDVVLSSANLP